MKNQSLSGVFLENLQNAQLAQLDNRPSTVVYPQFTVDILDMFVDRSKVSAIFYRDTPVTGDSTHRFLARSTVRSART